MALIHCPECGKEISDQAPNCIHCGYPVAQKAQEAQEAQAAREARQAQERLEAEAAREATALEGTYAVVLMNDVPNPKDVLSVLQNSAGMSYYDACDAVGRLPFPVWQGLTLEEAYQKAGNFENCGVVKVVRGKDIATREDMTNADPTPPPSAPAQPRGGLGFGGTVLAVVVGIVVAVILLSLF